MKNFKYITGSGVALLLITLSFISCIDGNDWEVDSRYDRLFSTSKVSVDASETEAEVSWTASPNNEYYIIEISKDSLYDAIELGATESSIIFGEDKSITKSPYMLKDLDGSTKYYFRMRAMSSTKNASNWSTTSDTYFKTKSEQIVESLRITSANTAELTWTPVEIDRIELLEGGEFLRDLDLTSEILSKGFIIIDNLKGSTTYTVNLYRGDNLRGYSSFQTAPEIPTDVDARVNFTATDSLNQELFDKLAAAGHKNVVLTFPANSVYYNSNKLYLPDDMSITFYGYPGGNKPVIAVQMLELGEVHGFITFQGLELSGYSQKEDGSNVQNEYLINQSNETNIGSITFSDCFINGFKNTPLRLQKNVTKTIREVIIDDCIIYGATSRTYSIIHVDTGEGLAGGHGKIEEISVTNSTIRHSGKSFIYSRDTDMKNILIENCTFSKVPGAGDYLIDFSNNENVLAGITESININNIILGSIGGATAKGIRCNKGTVNVFNSYKTTDWTTTGNAINNLIDYEGSEKDLFANPDEGDFTIIDSFFEGRNDAGDPRWR